LKNPQSYCITDLSSYVETPEITDVAPDYKFYLGFNNHHLALEDVFDGKKFDHFMSEFYFILKLQVL
jgi:hypothetical protein